MKLRRLKVYKNKQIFKTLPTLFFMNFLEQLVDVGTFVGVIVAIGALAWQIKGQREDLNEVKKTRSAEIAHYYNKRLLEDRFLVISRIISLAEINSNPIHIGVGLHTKLADSTVNEFDLSNYLTEMETLGLFINDGVISEKYAYELFGDHIDSIFKNYDISSYMEDTRKIQNDFWDNLYKSHKTLADYKNKKLKK